MATRAQIIEARLIVGDPSDCVAIVDVALLTDLPSAPLAQTAYYVAATSGYYATQVVTGAVLADYSLLPIVMSDTRLGVIIDSKGVNGGAIALWRALIASLGKQMLMVKNSDGAESTEYQRILDLYSYYKKVLADFEEVVAEAAGTSTGSWVVTPNPCIGEGSV
jgi:hypothetical protein